MKAKTPRKTAKKKTAPSSAAAPVDTGTADPSRLKVHQLARLLGTTSKEILERCHARGVELKNHMAVITSELAEQIRAWFGGAAAPVSAEVVPAATESSRFRPEPLTGGAPASLANGPQVEASEDALTIRFPPAAPPPFIPLTAKAVTPPTRSEPRPFDERPAQRPEVTGGAPAAGGRAELPRERRDEPRGRSEEQRGRDDNGRRGRDAGRSVERPPREADRLAGGPPAERGGRAAEVRSDEPRPGGRSSTPPPRERPRAERPPAGERGAAGPSDDLLTQDERQRLSPSQKRRLRRRRRRERELSEGRASAPAARPSAPVDEFEDAEDAEFESAGADSPVDERMERRVPVRADFDIEDEDDVEDEDDGDGPDGGMLSAVIEPDVEVEEAPEQLYAAEEAAEPYVEDELDELEGEAGPARAEPGTAARRDDERDGRGRRGRRGGRGRDRDRRGRYDDREQPTLAADISPDDRGVAEPSGPPTREMIINVVPREECRIAVLHEGKLEEIYLERASSENYVSNIYKGVVTNVEPSIQAAFIDFGMGKNGFLHISDLHPEYFPNNEGHHETVGRKTPRKLRPPIQKCLRRGQELIVQVNKEGIGTKGPTLSTYLSIPGRFLVMMPGMKQLGVSRRIENEDQRRQLRGLLNQLELPDGMGFIARTAAVGRTVAELQGDLNYLARLWRAVEQRRKHDRAPCELYRESDLVIRTIRDVFTSDIRRIIVDDADVVQRARDFLSIFNPSYGDIVVEYKDPQPIFHRYGIEAELERLHSRHVPLKSGGSLVIDQTEALVAIDVNSGKYRTEDDAETTAYKIDLEAANEIPRQLRLRDLGGVIICDFIDVRLESHRREIERRLIENLRKHKERCKVLRMSAFGIVEMTRQRQRASLQRSVYRDCHFCRGTGLVKTAESVALDVMRLIQLAMTREAIHTIEVLVSPEVAYLIQNRKRRTLSDLEAAHRRVILIRAEAGYGLDQVEVRCADARGRVVPHA